MTSMKSKIFFAGMLFLLLLACKDKPAEDDAMVDLPADFQEFYNRFHSDSAFQMESIVFPLEGKPSGISAEEIRYAGGFKWQKDVWKLHKPFEDLDNEFEREYELFGDMVIEVIKVKGSSIGMERRFAKINGEWTLIYYSAMNMRG